MISEVLWLNSCDILIVVNSYGYENGFDIVYM